MSAFWDGRFAAGDYVYGTEPNAHLVAQAWRLKPGGRVLVPGDGEGRNGVWLARRGFAVESVDGSAVGLAKARALAARHGVRLTTTHADLTQWSWPRDVLDGVVSIFLHVPAEARPGLHTAMAAALAPGGILILQGFSPRQIGLASGGPRDPAMLFDPDALRRDFAGLDIVALDEIEAPLDEGPFHQGVAALVRLVARRAA